MKKLLTLAALTISTTLLLSGCQAINDAVNDRLQGGIQTGSWSEDGKTFTNEWSGIGVTLLDGFRALSSEELQATVGAGEDVLVNDGGLKKSDVDAAKLRTAYTSL